MPHLHFPLQSGSDRILSAMHRGYTAERYLEKLVEARSMILISPSAPTSSSASPARPTPISSARSRSQQRPSTTRPTRSSTRPAPAPRPPRWSRTSATPMPSRSATPRCAQ
ncbi:MAG: hypothetical protein R2710_13145 [Acidimicrobiales bacterium]